MIRFDKKFQQWQKFQQGQWLNTSAPNLDDYIITDMGVRFLTYSKKPKNRFIL